MPTLLNGIMLALVSCLICLNSYAGQIQGPLIVLGSFSSPLNAEQMLLSIQPHIGANLRIDPVHLGGPLYRVAAGPFESLEEAHRQIGTFRQHIPDAWLDVSQMPAHEVVPVALAVTRSGAHDKETLLTDIKDSRSQDSQVIIIKRFENYDAALVAAERWSRQFAMPLLISPVDQDVASQDTQGIEAPGFKVQTLGMDQTIAPLVLALIKARFPFAVLEPSAC